MKFIKKLLLILFASQIVFGHVQQVNAMDRLPKQVITMKNFATKILKLINNEYDNFSKFAIIANSLLYFALKYIKVRPEYFLHRIFGEGTCNNILKEITKAITVALINFAPFSEEYLTVRIGISLVCIIYMFFKIYRLKIYESFLNQPTEQSLNRLHDVEINASRPSGLTPLMLYSTQGDKQLVENLIKRKVQLDKTDYYKDTALIYSIAYNKPEITQLLLFAGANPEIRNDINKNMFDYINEIQDVQHKRNFDQLIEKYNFEYVEPNILAPERKRIADAITQCGFDSLQTNDINNIIASYCVGQYKHA